ncbi:xanthine dehydrogenase family protein molybdopterin-binding subunit [Persicimonas caeni]|uniref:Xanthine dehydrogenase family protein molybdopterin-binding subunit n=1 Tax=Persicimonas caeni TaxID=2292766 RepID=A0A4Y6PM57_PERCE|nr:molybdopterin cofactor-binding domain-containing protein [Persicimonas caeni]QDG49378.1 xanthine dehydrogenase family protein molybdopterin-binding subunit [Persicimonas caeni]QED30599.1 xanthine dehydrogenase family protein molybdopterin-binding subunit [Persicimonas caeni]
MNRRDFLRVSLLGGGAFLMGVSFAGCANPAVRRMQKTVESNGAFQPNAYVTVTPDDRVLVGIGKSEMGQGVFTHHAMLVAEELEVDLDRVEPFHAEAGPEFHTLGMQMTGGSTSVSDTYEPFRRAAATARVMFVAAAAQEWGCRPGECEAREGAVHHKKSGRTLRYGELTRAAAQQEIPDDVALKKPEDFKVLGKPKKRVDLLDKVTGKAEFGLDFEVDGMVKALVIRPPVIGQRAKSFDADKARAMQGIVDIFAFDRGVAVVAEKYWQAKRAAPHVEVRWGRSPLEKFSTDDLRKAAREREDLDDEGVVMRHDGDVDDAFDEAAKVVEASYEAPYLAHAPLEPQNGTAYVQKDRVDIWAPVQWQSAVQGDVARLVGVDRDQVHVHTTMLGGGFGRRLVIDYIIEAVLLSRELGKPVQVVWSREDDTKGGYYRPFSHTRMRGALDAKGNPTAVSYHSMSQSLLDLDEWLPTMLPEWVPRVTKMMMARTMQNAVDSDSLPNVLATEGAFDANYKIPNWKVAYTQIHLDVPVSFWRSVGHSFNAFVVESFIDELAHAAQKDPYAFRRRLLADDPRKLAVLDRAAKMGGWGTALDDGWGRGIAVHKSFGSYCAQVIEAGVFDGEIQVRRVACAIDCGLALNPDVVASQMESCIAQGLSAAIWQKIDFEDGRVAQANFDTFPFIRMHQVPQIDVAVVDSDEDPTGVGEPGLPPVAPALAGAVFAATGKRLRKMPFVDALEEA